MNIRLRNHLIGGLIYALGDSIAALITNQWDIVRLGIIFIIGATIYAWEINKYFAWIERKVKTLTHAYKKWIKASLALLYFNPVWIARHMLFVQLAAQNWNDISTNIFKAALWAFIVNIPISIIANYIIQNKVVLSYRFWASALFSGLMAVYYSMSTVWWG